jgi:outer membrane protein TolC
MTVGTQAVALGVPETTITQLSLALPLDISRQISTAVESADLARLAQEFGLAAVRQSVALEVQEAYLAVLRAQALENVAREALAAAQEHHQIAQLQQKAGVVAPFDVLRAEVQVASYRQDLLAKQNAVDLAIANLNRVMGTDVNRPLRLVEPALTERAGVELAASQQEAEQRRPEVLQAQTLLQAARKGIKLARAGLQPSFTLTGGYSYDANPSDLGGQSESWNASAAVSLLLFDSGATHARVRQAQADVATAELGERDARQQVSLEVRQAYLSLHEAEQRMSTTEKDVAQARETLRLAQARYRAGVSASVEVTDAEVAFARSLSSQVNARYDYEPAQARLDRAIGRPLGQSGDEENRS